MGLAKMVLTAMLSICNLFRFLTPIKANKITFISMTADHLEHDFLALDRCLKKRGGYDLHYNLIVFKKGLLDDFRYMLNCFRQLYEINTSKLIILNDNNFVVTKFKRKGTYVLQTWHACGAIKKFGNQLTTRQYPVKNYDVILANSSYWTQAYSEAFGVKQEQIAITGMPRVDVLMDQAYVHRQQVLFDQKYPQLKNQYKILYAPTFRGNVIDGLRYDTIDFEKLLAQLPKDTVILYKMHPLLKNISLGEQERFLNVSDEELYMLLCSCDCLVSDYSSILFDYSLLHKKAVCYASDYQDYAHTIGFNVKYKEEMPMDICESEKELLACLQTRDFDEERLRRFQQRFMEHTDGKNTERVSDLIERIMKDDR